MTVKWQIYNVTISKLMSTLPCYYVTTYDESSPFLLHRISTDHRSHYKSVVFLAGAAGSHTPMSAIYLHSSRIDYNREMY